MDGQLAMQGGNFVNKTHTSLASPKLGDGWGLKSP
jgi:hypothetical protein